MESTSMDLTEDMNDSSESIGFQTQKVTFEEDTYDPDGYRVTLPKNHENQKHTCANDTLIMMEPYQIESDDLLMIYLYSKDNSSFDSSFCIYRNEELKEYIKRNNNVFMCIYTDSTKTDEGEMKAGYGTRPTNRVIVKLPNNIYVTFSSMYNLLHDPDNKHFYLLPLYDNKRKRIGNLKGTFGASMNHGQAPGEYIYTCRTLKELEKNNFIPPYVVKDYILTEEQLSLDYSEYTTDEYSALLLDILING
jgi:hypothetical protein